VATYTGNGTDGETIGHGLSQSPDMIIVKDRTNSASWRVMHKDINYASNTLYLDATYGETADDRVKAVSSTNFTVTSGGGVNGSSRDHVAYCFHSVEGYSKIGSYTGNGSSDGVYVHLGFRPSWVMVKRTDSTGNWIMYDNKRPEYNSPYYLIPNTSFGGDGSDNPIDFLSNGFKLKTAGGGNNVSSGSYIFLAFAEAPFSKSNAR
jgi:hypothetical protein